MISKFKKWLYERFLPAYFHDDLLEANKNLIAKLEAKERDIERLNAYIDGVENAMLRQSRIIINAKEVSTK